MHSSSSEGRMSLLSVSLTDDRPSSPAAQIPDDFTGYSLESFCLPLHYVDKVESVLVPHGLIMDRYGLQLLSSPSRQELQQQSLIKVASAF